MTPKPLTRSFRRSAVSKLLTNCESIRSARSIADRRLALDGSMLALERPAPTCPSDFNRKSTSSRSLALTAPNRCCLRRPVKRVVNLLFVGRLIHWKGCASLCVRWRAP